MDVEACFSDWLTILSEAYKHKLSAPTVAMYCQYLLSRLSWEQFERSCQELFEVGGEKLPSPQEWCRLARELVPDKQLAPASEPPTVYELSEADRLACMEAIRKAAGIVRDCPKPYTSKVMGAVGSIAATSTEVTPGIPKAVANGN